MECETEDPTGYLAKICLLTFHLGTLGHSPCDWNVFPDEWFIVVIVEMPPSIDQIVDLSHRVTEWETLKIWW